MLFMIMRVDKLGTPTPTSAFFHRSALIWAFRRQLVTGRCLARRRCCFWMASSCGTLSQRTSCGTVTCCSLWLHPLSVGR